MFCTAFALTLGLSLSSQCPQESAWEVAYQTLHDFDYATTITGVRSQDCVEEEDWLTSRIIGHHPSEARVYGMWIGEAMIHYAVSGWLARTAEASGSRAWYIANDVWNVAGVAMEAQRVVQNTKIGLRPFGGSICPKRSTRDYER